LKHEVIAAQAGCTELEQSEGGIESNAQALEAAQGLLQSSMEAYRRAMESSAEFNTVSAEQASMEQLVAERLALCNAVDG